MKKIKTLATGLALALSLSFVGSAFADESQIDNEDDIYENIKEEMESHKEYKAKLMELKERYYNLIKNLNLSFSESNEYLEKINDATTEEAIIQYYNEAKSISDSNEEKFPGRSRSTMDWKNAITFYLRSIKISDDGELSGNYAEESEDISEDDYDMIIEQLNTTNDKEKIDLLIDYARFLINDNNYSYEEGEEGVEVEEGFDEEPEPNNADKSFLKKLLEKNYKKEDYTEESYKFYKKIYDRAKDVYDEEDPAQSSVDTVVLNLKTAGDLLEKKEEDNKKEEEEAKKDENIENSDQKKDDKSSDEIIKKIEDLKTKVEIKLGALDFIKEKMPETYKRYAETIDKVIRNAENNLKIANQFLESNK